MKNSRNRRKNRENSRKGSDENSRKSRKSRNSAQKTPSNWQKMSDKNCKTIQNAGESIHMIQENQAKLGWAKREFKLKKSSENILQRENIFKREEGENQSHRGVRKEKRYVRKVY